MNPAEFAQYAAQGYTRIPLVREVLADLDTPLSTYLKLAGTSYSYLLESVEGGEKWGRYSIIGLPCRTIMRVRGDTITVEQDGEIIEQHACVNCGEDAVVQLSATLQRRLFNLNGRLL